MHTTNALSYSFTTPFMIPCRGSVGIREMSKLGTMLTLRLSTFRMRSRWTTKRGHCEVAAQIITLNLAFMGLHAAQTHIIPLKSMSS